MFTGQSSDTRRLVVAISLSGSAVSFSLTVGEVKNKQQHIQSLISDCNLFINFQMKVTNENKSCKCIHELLVQRMAD